MSGFRVVHRAAHADRVDGPPKTYPVETFARRQDGAHLRGESRFIVEQPERRKMIGAAGVIAPALAGADKDAGRRAKVADWHT